MSEEKQKVIFDVEEEELKHLQAAAKSAGFDDFGRYLVNMFLRLNEALEAHEDQEEDKSK